MGNTLDELISEAKDLHIKINSADKNDEIKDDDFEKLACNLEACMKNNSVDYKKEAFEKATNADKEYFEKLASFCTHAIKKGHSEEEVIAYMEKLGISVPGGGLYGLGKKVVKSAIGAPLKVGKEVLTGSPASNLARTTSSGVKKQIAKKTKTSTEKFYKRHVQMATAAGKSPKTGSYEKFKKSFGKRYSKEYAASLRPKSKAPVGESRLRSIAKKAVKPALYVGAGVAGGKMATDKLNEYNEGKRQPAVSYGY